MSTRGGRFILAFAALLFARHQALAQTSSVVVLPDAQASGEVAATPLSPFEITDIDYPFDSLFANEEGDVTVALAIDSSGRVTDSRLAGLSRYQSLNQQSLRLGRQRWQFHPATRDGTPVDSFLRLRISWRLPLEPVKEFRIALPAASEGIQTPKPINLHNVVANDYPASAVHANRQGTVAARYFVDEMGNVARTAIDSSSGVPSLDDATTALVKRWKFTPATLNGTPTGAWMAAIMSFEIRPAAFDRRGLRCYPKPIDYENAERILLTATLIQPAPRQTQIERFERWTYVDEKGEPTDTLLLTAKGLMRLSPQLRAAMKQAGYPRPGGEGCWYFDPIYAQR